MNADIGILSSFMNHVSILLCGNGTFYLCTYELKGLLIASTLGLF